uniref:Uncharacterized protein n=1 Tax=Candidatus Enterococcus clewellii TaxID=1834193 RepID=A0A242K2F0_9ENTE|nr:hypothetical protein [Enterococcus sp. 9E7_DIV0242]OTP12674.1 hypothetical protein A5888_003252 [Enterococcus sp. 9E7_DIV0242]
MKKVALTLVTIGACLTLVACGSNGNKTEKSSASTNEQSTKESTEDSATKHLDVYKRQVLDSLGYSDQELLEFAQWYYDCLLYTSRCV